MPHPSRAYNPFMQKKKNFTNKKIPMLWSQPPSLQPNLNKETIIQ